jgi:hypothetical protein
MESPFAGVWRLVSCEAVRGNGTAVPIYGREPVGRLYYDENGNMSVHIMRAGRRPIQGDSKFGRRDGDVRAAFEGYEAYFSTYAVDTERRTIEHTVIGSLFPNWTGTIQRRFYEFEGRNRLVLSSEPPGSAGRETTVVRLVWERLA